MGHLREAGNVLRQVGDLVARCREGNDNGMIQYCDAAELRMTLILDFVTQSVHSGGWVTLFLALRNSPETFRISAHDKQKLSRASTPGSQRGAISLAKVSDMLTARDDACFDLTGQQQHVRNATSIALPAVAAGQFTYTGSGG